MLYKYDFWCELVVFVVKKSRKKVIFENMLIFGCDDGIGGSDRDDGGSNGGGGGNGDSSGGSVGGGGGGEGSGVGGGGIGDRVLNTYQINIGP